MQLLSATVRYAPEVRTAASGRTYSSVAVSIPGEQSLARIFGPENYGPLMALQPGQEIRVARDSRDRLHLVEPGEQTQEHPAQPAAGFMGFQAAPAPAPAPVVPHQASPAYQAAPAPTPAPADPAIAAADLLARIYGRLIQQGVPETVAGPMSSTAFIQLSRG